MTHKASIAQTTFDLSVKNPDGGEEVVHRSLRAIIDEIAALDVESATILAGIRRQLLSNKGVSSHD